MTYKRQAPARDGGRQQFSSHIETSANIANPATAQATAAERRQAGEVARFVQAYRLSRQPLLIRLALVARRFPYIPLASALAGVVYQRALLQGDGHER